MRKLSAILVSVACLLSTLSFWWVLRRSERRHITRLTRLAARAIEADLTADVGERIHGLVRLTKAAELGQPTDPELDTMARLFIEHNPGVVAIEFVDRRFHVTKEITEHGRKAALDLDLSTLPDGPELQRGAEQGLPVIVGPLFSGADGVIYRRIAVATFTDGSLSGFLTTKVDVTESLRSMLADVAKLGYSMEVYEGSTRLFASPGGDYRLAAEWQQFEDMHGDGLNWTVRAWPDAFFLRQLRSYLPEAALILGFALSGLVVTCMYLAAQASLRSRQTEVAYRNLEAENAERVMAEQALRESQARFAGVLEMSPDAIVSVDTNHRITLFNQGAENIFGYKSGEVIGRPLEMLLPAVSRDTHREQISGFADGASDAAPRNMAPRARAVLGIRKDGTEFPLEASISKLELQGEKILTAILRDITERCQAEEMLRRVHEELELRVEQRTLELQRANASLQQEIAERKQMEENLRQLSSRLLQLQDEERRRIARELHDSTGQYLAALALNLHRVQVSRDIPDNMQLLLEETSTLLEQCSSEIRTMSYLLHPPLLDHVGLASALQWYVEGFVKRSGIAVEVAIAPDVGRFAPEQERTFFRIVQESLTNVRRHSGATDGCVSLYCHSGEAYLEISDNGKGMPSVKEYSEVVEFFGVGVAGMRERVRQFGGRLEIISGTGGTTVRAVLPLETDAVRLPASA